MKHRPISEIEADLERLRKEGRRDPYHFRDIERQRELLREELRAAHGIQSAAPKDEDASLVVTAVAGLLILLAAVSAASYLLNH